MTIYVATTNPGKLRDFAAAADPRITLLPLPGLKELDAPAEDEPTFEGNARIKAIYYSEHMPGEIVMADDSGLEVDTLDGAPGVRSARYADDEAFALEASLSLDERNNRCLLHALEAIPQDQRQGRYHCVLAAARNGQVLAIGSGTVEGSVLTAPRGTQGFGYDPLFLIPEFEKTMAELDTKTKLTISHRGRAFTALTKALAEAVDLDAPR
jgi:XTP/dITP diphosphohydrolase